MIHRYDFGSPIDTGATVRSLPVSGGTLSYFTVSRRDESLCFSLSLQEDDIIFGLGEANRGINKRGYLYTSWNSDDGNETSIQLCSTWFRGTVNGGMYCTECLVDPDQFKQ